MLGKKKSEDGGGNGTGSVSPSDNGKRERRRKRRDREPEGSAAPPAPEATASQPVAAEAAGPSQPTAAGGPPPTAPPSVAVTGGTSSLPAADANFFAWIAERPFPTKEAAEQEAARELQQAAGASLDLLVASVPGAHSPDEAYSSIESRLGEKLDDTDAVVPRHPLWSDDTVVYYHLRRHFGENVGTQSMQRRRPSWFPIKSFGPLE